ncbi:ABC-three component system middle component 5 [Novosphingobium sp.]|uniref:ABC-three component system middle component 5 n=1 Tax=Novosphingobium sp. TaxID=1874826 RepID=UPI003423452A
MGRCITSRAIAIWRGTMADLRVWYASRDPYHCIFRMVRLMTAKDEPMPLEQLRILDMFPRVPALAAPPVCPGEYQGTLSCSGHSNAR